MQLLSEVSRTYQHACIIKGDLHLANISLIETKDILFDVISSSSISLGIIRIILSNK